MSGEPTCASPRAGVLYGCGVGKWGCLPVDSRFVDKAGEVVYPAPLRFPSSTRFTAVAADMSMFGALDSDGGLWMWRKSVAGAVAPVIVARDVRSFDIGATFIIYITTSGSVFQYGRGPYVSETAAPAARDGTRSPRASLAKSATAASASDGTCVQVNIPRGGSPASVAACDRTFMVSCSAGDVFVCGHGPNTGMAGTSAPDLVKLELPPTAQLSLGSIHGAAVTRDGHLFVWGDGANGCLGVARRVPLASSPIAVTSFQELGLAVKHVACTRGQPSPKRVMRPFSAGQEGPRTHVVTADGALWIAGTGHKGLAADHLHKVMMPKSDLLSFQRVGGPAADAGCTPVATGAAERLLSDPKGAADDMGLVSPDHFGLDGRTHYLENVSVSWSQPGHIHSLALSSSGKLFAWGCGSDGRTGLRAYLNGPGGSKRTLKCYVSTPTAIEAFAGKHVIAAAAGRYWTLAIVSDDVS